MRTPKQIAEIEDRIIKKCGNEKNVNLFAVWSEYLK